MAVDLTIAIPDDVVARLERQAADNGQPLAAFLTRLIVAHVSRPTLDEIYAPIRENFARSGMTEDELLDLGRTALAEVRQAKNAKSR